MSRSCALCSSEPPPPSPHYATYLLKMPGKAGGKAKPLTKPKAGEKVVLDEDIAFKKKQQEEVRVGRRSRARTLGLPTRTHARTLSSLHTPGARCNARPQAKALKEAAAKLKK